MMRDFWKFSHKTPWKADLYNEFSEEGGNIPPPFTDLRITQLNQDRITMAGDKRRVM